MTHVQAIWSTIGLAWLAYHGPHYALEVAIAFLSVGATLAAVSVASLTPLVACCCLWDWARRKYQG